MTSLIAAFPYEVLLHLFKFLDFPAVLRASHICGQWRDISLDNSELWATITITQSSTNRLDILSRILERSKRRPLCLRLNLPLMDEDPTDYDGLRCMLQKILRPHLHRCFRMFVHAHEEACSVILDAFSGEDFPALRMLDFRNDDAESQWQTIEPPALTPAYLIFPLPHNHPLRSACLHGVSLGDTILPSLVNLKIGHHVPTLPSATDRSIRGCSRTRTI